MSGNRPSPLSLSIIYLILFTVLTLLASCASAPAAKKTVTKADPRLNPVVEAIERQDYATALPQLNALAGAGVPQAQAMLGYLYATGTGVKRDDSKAFELLAKAAKQGEADAQSNLGFMYANGRGVKADYKKAIHWYLKAAQKDHEVAQRNLSAIQMKISDPRKGTDRTRATVRAKANKGMPLYQYLLGMSYIGELVDQNKFDKAIPWLTKSADQGYAPAQFKLGSLYAEGQGVSRDEAMANRLIRRAAQKNYPAAVAWIREHDPSPVYEP